MSERQAGVVPKGAVQAEAVQTGEMPARAWLAVYALPGVGAAKVARIVAQAPIWPHGWLALLPAPAAAALRHWLAAPEKSPLDALWQSSRAWQAAAPNRHLLHRGHPAWPPLLDEIADPPVVLWAQGDLEALALPGLAMVGTRRPTNEGIGNARSFSRELVARGWCIVSGMALGVDGIAQEAALEAGGASIAVLGSGIDVIYPARHRELYERLSQRPKALVLAEHPPGTQAHPAFFPRRNRIVTGLSLGTLVIEATEKSGSLVSARLALEQNRELFVLPGSLHNVQSRGCLTLIRQGAAHLVFEAEHIVEQLGQWAPLYVAPEALEGTSVAAPNATSAPHFAPSDDPLLQALDHSPTPIDLLVQRIDVSVSECQQRLLMLELEGQAAQQAGGWVRLG